MPTSPRRQFRLVPSRPFPASSRPVRGKFSCNDDLCWTPWERLKVVLRGLDPRIHAFVSTAPRRGCPRIEVRGLKAHGSSPAKTKLAGEFLPLVAARFFPGQPCAKSGIGLRRWFGIGKHAGDWAIMERIDGGMPPGGPPWRVAVRGFSALRSAANLPASAVLCSRVPVTSFLLPLAPYPRTRLRRNRGDPWSRKLVAETILTAGDLIWPVFVHDEGHKEPIPSMPEVFRLPIPALVDAAGEAAELGIPVVAVFPAVPSALKDAEGSNALDPGNLVCRAVAALKEALPELGVLCDVALDPFTSHGHDGVIRDGYVANDETVEILQRQAVIQAEAGCDIIAPSDMMDGRVGAVREALDEAGFERVRIMSYAAKYASSHKTP